MEYQKIVNLLDTASNNASRFNQKKKEMDRSLRLI